MDKEIAKALMALAVATDEPIGRMFVLIEEIENPEMKARFKTAVGDLMGKVFTEIMAPIEKIYPDLTPERH